MKLSSEIKNKILNYQKNEITEYHIYSGLAGVIKCPDNSRVLQTIADDKLRHYKDCRKYTGQDVMSPH